MRPEQVNFVRHISAPARLTPPGAWPTGGNPVDARKPTVEVPLTGRYANGRCALIDACDAGVVEGIAWYCMPEDYARGRLGDGSQRTVAMHRLILGALDSPLQADHINRDRLDNRRCNLRLVPSRINRQNTGPQGGRSRFRGVYFEASKQRWRARVMLNGKKHALGYFMAELDAALAVEAFRAEHMPWVAPDNSLPPRNQPRWLGVGEWPATEEAA